ncbi:MAG: hypothetical protein ACQESF_00700 [Nanobdellota archaeon]
MWGKTGATGIGILIVLLAFLLVAAVAASVLILNSGELQKDSISTASSARKQVTTGVDLVDLSARDARDGTIEDFRYLVKLNPGAEPIDLEKVILYVNTHNETLRLTYREGVCQGDPANGYYTIN